MEEWTSNPLPWEPLNWLHLKIHSKAVYNAGGYVKFRDDDQKAPLDLKAEYLTNLLKFFDLMDYKVEMVPSSVNSFAYAHKIGLKIEEEYDLLLLIKEEERLQYLNRHLINIMSLLRNIEESKRKIKLNGHFKLLDPLDF